MNILVMVSSLECGGAEKQSVIAANKLAQSHCVHLVTFKDGDLSRLLDDGIDYRVIKKSNYLMTAIKLVRFCRKHRIEIIHAHLFAAMVVAALASVVTHTCIFWTFHGHRYESETRGRLTLTGLSRLPSVKKIFFVSRELVDYYFRKGFHFPVKKVAVVYNSFEPGSEVQVVDNTLLQRTIIGFVGRLVKLKRIDRLLQAAKFLLYHNITDFEIWIVGDGDLRLQIDHEIQMSALASHVTMWGYREDILELYRQMDLFVLPSEEEGLSLALIEAGAAGLPAIAFDVGGNAEIIEDGVNGFICGNEIVFRDRILTLMLDKVLRSQMGHNAQNIAFQKFSADKHLIQLETAFSETA